MSAEAAPFDFEKFDQMMFNSRLVFACAFSIMLWEQIISFREEYTVVWQTGVKWSLAKAVFVLNRYLAIIGLTLYVIWFTFLPTGVCSHVHWLPTVFCLISLGAGDVILGLRVFALWGKNMFVALALGAVLLGQWSFSAFISHKNAALPIPGGPCLSMTGENLQRFEKFTNIGCLFYEVLAVALVFARVYKYRKAGGTGGLIELIFKDSAQYFVVVFCAKLLTGLNFWLNKESPAIFMPITISLVSIMCSRVFFNLVSQSQAQSTLNSSTSWRRSNHGISKVTASSTGSQRHSIQLPDEKDKEEIELEDALHTLDVDVERGNEAPRKQ